MKKRVLCVVGTRPEAIKMAPVILALKKEKKFDVKVLATAQHRQMLDQVLNFFDIQPDIDLDLMQPNQSLTLLTSRLLSRLDDVLLIEKPDVVLVQGDTTTVMTVSLACFYHRIPIGHIEAGLRTWDIYNPFPEEANRVITGRLAKWHFAPTQSSKENLLKEGVVENSIFVTGNTVIDALLMTAAKDITLDVSIPENQRMILITSHRRENFGQPFREICAAIKYLANQNLDVFFLYPVHPNPNVKDVAYEILGDCKNICLCEPLDYAPFVAAMKRSYFIISDSGGVQEEAPALSKPVLVLREETERPEAVDLGVVRLLGANYDKIIEVAQSLLDNEEVYRAMAKGISPYGDGHSASRIAGVLVEYFS
ncbi:MAG TPA: UDP-N-acetylglucosamine 2-epimerase (non-hydrolyzing) [Agitococcus sp.]|nr:UDP-N-acetylglucosamine 2-epimerase (non-hydrolyzing) [Agitococcus sp.]